MINFSEVLQDVISDHIYCDFYVCDISGVRDEEATLNYIETERVNGFGAVQCTCAWDSGPFLMKDFNTPFEIFDRHFKMMIVERLF